MKLVLDLLIAAVVFTLVSIIVWAKHDSSGAAVGLAFIVLLDFRRVAAYALESMVGCETSSAALVRLETLQRNKPQEKKSCESIKLPRDWPSAGAVDFTGVSSRYQPADNVPPIIRDFTVAMDAQDKVGILGRTYSGKSSILLTLFGFMYYSGTVEIDEVNIAGLNPDVLRSRIITIT